MSTKAEHQAAATSALSVIATARDPRSKLDAALAYASLAATTNQSANVAAAEALLAEIEGKSTVSLPAGELARVHAELAKVTT